MHPCGTRKKMGHISKTFVVAVAMMMKMMMKMMVTVMIKLAYVIVMMMTIKHNNA